MNINPSILIPFFIFSFAMAYFINKYVHKKSIKYNLRKSNISADRWEDQAKPNFGGISFYVIFILVLLFYLFSEGIHGIGNNHLLACVLVVTLSFFMGLADDLLNTSPYFKFIVQFINATILIFFGIYINVFDSVILNYILTYLLVIGIMNSINMLDNMDSISSLISITIMIGAFMNIILGAVTANLFSSYFIVGVLGALLSFVVFFNWNPSKMYMGDNGSQLIGSILAVVGISFFWNTYQGDTYYTFNSFLITGLAFLIPLVDTTTVTINRLLQKKSPFIGGKDHTTHHLSYAGLNDRKVVILLSLISIIAVSMSVTISNFIRNLTLIQTILFVSFAIIVFIVLYSITKTTKPKIRK